MTQPKHSFTLVHDQAAIAARVREMATQINAIYAGTPLLVIAVLKGAFIFCADLVRELNMPLEVDFIRLSSYGRATQSSETVQLGKDVESSLTGRHVLIVEDIVDTGLSMAFLRKELEARGAASIRLAAFVDKPERRQVPMHVDFTGFVVPSGFVVGYGLDYAEKYRELPGIYVLNIQE